MVGTPDFDLPAGGSLRRIEIIRSCGTNGTLGTTTPPSGPSMRSALTDHSPQLIRMGKGTWEKGEMG